jgi:hypothetical protein
MKIFISSNPENLRAILKDNPSITIEAEYGDICIEGSLLTLAHHGERCQNPAPCKHNNLLLQNVFGQEGKEIYVGVSHLDMDTLGGIMSVSGLRDSKYESFWDLVAFVDVNGLHKLDETMWPEEDILSSYACQAMLSGFFAEFKIPESVEDVTLTVSRIVEKIGAILRRDASAQEFLDTGKMYRETQEKLNRNSYIEDSNGVALRINAAFTNHLYRLPDGRVMKAVVAFRPAYGSITISFADLISDAQGVISCRKIAQELWGPEAGGRDNIAGSPRNKRMKLSDIEQIYELLSSRI